jgi:hypothetical protein
MLIQLAPNLWNVQREFTALGLKVSSRMTVVRLKDGSLWLHSPIRLDDALIEELRSLGEVRAIVCPNKMHHLFAHTAVRAFPDAQLFGAPGLAKKRPDLVSMVEFKTDMSNVPSDWQDDLDHVFFAGIPLGNETVWLHKPSKTLILTDSCQWWQGELNLPALIVAKLTGVRDQLAVPRTIRMSIKDRAAVAQSAQQILTWDFDRVIVAHNSIVETGGKEAVTRAFAVFGV